MKAPPAFQFYAADWLADLHVMGMSEQEEGIYIRLLSICWREGSLPADPGDLARLTKARTEVPQMVRDRFTICAHDPTRLVHLRLESERQKQEEWREQQSRNARKGWKRKPKPSTGGGNAMAKPRQSRRNALQSSSSSSSSSSFSSSPASSDPPQPPQGVDTNEAPPNGKLTLAKAMTAIARGSGGRFASSPFPKGMGPRLQPKLDELVADGVTEQDCEAAGEFLKTWPAPVGPKYLAKEDNFADLIAKARIWASEGKPNGIARGSPGSGMSIQQLDQFIAFAKERGQ